MKAFINFFNKYKIYLAISFILSILIIIFLFASTKKTYFIENGIPHFILSEDQQIIKVHPLNIEHFETNNTKNATIYDVINKKKK